MVLIVIAVIVVAVVATCVKVVPQTEARVVERLGSYIATWGNGLHMLVPFIDRVSDPISLKEQVADFPPQPVITRDNVTMLIDTVVYYKVMDAKLYAYGVENPVSAIENLTATTLRNIVGDMDLDTTLTSRDAVNGQIRAILDEATDPWGVKVNRVEVKNIQPPKDIQASMERQMKAERDKRAAILEAEGRKQSAITVAEGDKQAKILAAEAERQRQILEAEGEAEAIRQVQQATADGIAAVKAAGADDAVLKLQSLEAWRDIADGRATKLIVPAGFDGLASLAAGLKEAVDTSAADDETTSAR